MSQEKVDHANPHKEESEDDDDKFAPKKIPWGLDVEKLAPSSIQLISDEKLKNFSVGPVKKSPFQKHKEEMEAKKKKEEDDAARIYAEFVKDFESSEPTNTKTFLRGETIVNSSVLSANQSDREYKLESRNKPENVREKKLSFIPPPSNNKNYENSSSSSSSSSSKRGEKKKRSIDELKEELKRKQESSSSRYGKSNDDEDAESKRKKSNAPSGFSSTITPPITPSSQSGPIPPSNPFQTAQIVVQIPSDLEVAAIINKLAQFVVKEGPIFEKIIAEREKKNPKFQFLQSPGSSEYNYYCWRVYSLLQGDTEIRWRTTPFQMYSSGPLWVPPPLGEKSEKNRGDFSRKLMEELKEELNKILNELTVERNSIKEAMGFALDHADSAGGIVQVITESIVKKETAIPAKVARLFLVSDILHNSSAPVPKASAYRTSFETKLPEIFQHLRETHRGITGRITAENLKEQILRILRIWGDWSLYPPEYMKKLNDTFRGTDQSQSQKESQNKDTTKKI